MPAGQGHAVPYIQRGIHAGTETSGRKAQRAVSTEGWKERGQRSREWEDARMGKSRERQRLSTTQ